MPRPVSDAIADGLPLWDTYEALFFLLTGIFLGLVLGFLFPSAWRSFRRRFRRVDKYRAEVGASLRQLKLQPKSRLLLLSDDEMVEEQDADFDLMAAFVAARYAVQENALREAANLYLQILGSEKVTRVQTNKALFELTQVYGWSGLTERAIETGRELLHRKPAQVDVFRLLLTLCAEQTNPKVIRDVIDTYAGPRTSELSRDVSHLLTLVAANLLQSRAQQEAIIFAKWAVRWSPAVLEPKLGLVRATSLLSFQDAGQPLDQLVLGFFVDVAELLSLYRQHPNRLPFWEFTLLNEWADFFDRHDHDVEQIIERLRNECLTQLNYENRKSEPEFLSDLEFLVSAVTQTRKMQAPTETRWHLAMARLLEIEPLKSRRPTAFVCSGCSELQSKFRWKCVVCQSWDTLMPWFPADAALPAKMDARPN